MRSAISFLIGTAVGAGVALLATPASGEEMRAWLGRKTREIKQVPGEKVEQAAEAAKARAGDLGSQVGKQAAEAAVEAVKENLFPEDRSA
jgi:gas vesicle protein